MAVLPGMQARRFGRIINIASEAGVAIVPGLAAYCVSKHALVALTEVIQEGNHDNGGWHRRTWHLRGILLAGIIELCLRTWLRG